ncbi:MAG: GDP-mannose 4,6-dehydratase [Candidatus Omnitrophota bacterium]|jgi:nucleoside-diphosphate-sugar epimerase
MKTFLVTGTAGFVASYTSKLLLQKGVQVVGLDNMNDYYDVRMKEYRLKGLKSWPNFSFYKCNIENRVALSRIFKKHRFNAVLNFAARANVPYSMKNPYVYMTTNADGALNLLEQCRKHEIRKFVLASTSSLYAGQKMPFHERLPVNTPFSPYAASKKAAEIMAYTYHYLYDIDVTIVRYFTVYGPAGRPDMSVFRFIKWIDEGKPLRLFGDGSQTRDFTYVEDIAAGSVKALKRVGYKIINLGSNDPYDINEMIALVEKNLGKKANIKHYDFHKINMQATWADISEAKKTLRWFPKVSLEQGIKRTVDWYLDNKSWLSKIKV